MPTTRRRSPPRQKSTRVAEEVYIEGEPSIGIVEVREEWVEPDPRVKKMKEEVAYFQFAAVMLSVALLITGIVYATSAPDQSALSALLHRDITAIAGQGHSILSRLLMWFGANPNAKDSLGNGALHKICQYSQDLNTMRLFLERGADVNSQNLLGVTPIELCATSSPSLALELLKAGAKPSRDILRLLFDYLRLNAGKIPVGEYTPYGNLVEHLLHHFPPAADLLDALHLQNATFLRTAYETWKRLAKFSKAGDAGLHIMRILLESGADANVRFPDADQGTLLHLAVKEEEPSWQTDLTHNPVVDLLLNCTRCHRVQVDAVDDLGNTPLFYSKSDSTAIKLLDHGASSQVRNKNGFSALGFHLSQVLPDAHTNIDREMIEIVRELHQRKAPMHGEWPVLQSLLLAQDGYTQSSRLEDHLEDVFEFAYVEGRLPLLRRLDLGRELSCCSAPHELLFMSRRSTPSLGATSPDDNIRISVTGRPGDNVRVVVRDTHIPYEKNFLPFQSRPASDRFEFTRRAADIDKLYIRIKSNYPVSVLASIV